MNDKTREDIENAVSSIRASAILLITVPQDFDEDTSMDTLKRSWQSIGYGILEECRKIREALGDEEEE